MGDVLMSDSRFWISADRYYRETHDEDAEPDGCALCGGAVPERHAYSLEGEPICRECEMNLPDPTEAAWES